MLLYVDKKKQRRRKIKIISLTSACILFILANIIHFNQTLHQTEQHLTNYQEIQKANNWYNNTEIVYTFHPKGSAFPQAIIIPQTINKENSLTIALAFSQIAAPTNKLNFTDEVQEKEYLQQIRNLFTTENKFDSQLSPTIVTTDFKQIASIIYENKLFPSALHYQHAVKQLKNEQIQQLLNEHFPPKKLPQNQLEKEQKAITKFAQAYKNELRNLVLFPKKRAKFTTQNLLLQNLGICITSTTNTLCETSPKKSLKANLKKILSHPDQTAPQKIVLLTSLQEISPDSPLEKDEGLFFRCGKRKTFILPQKNNPPSNNQNIYAYLKQQAGINPNYHSEEMKFYKFKTTEIDINDNI